MASSLAEPSVPFWQAATMAAEPLVFVAEGDAAATARLLFSPAGPVHVTNAAGDRRFMEGVDFEVDRGARRLRRLPGSAIPHVDAHGPRPVDVEGMRHVTACASYAHAGDVWDEYTPPHRGDLLPRTQHRLRHREAMCLGILGDSISEGYDASGFHGTAPRQAPYARIVVDGLTRLSGRPVTLHNLAAAGSTSDDGRWLAAEMAARDPHLVIVAFGMNDAGYADAPHFAANIADIVRRVSEARPGVEFVLVSPMRPTVHCSWVNHDRFTAYRDALQALSGQGIAVADVMAMWDAVLTRKQAWELSGNGSNHPNDFGHRVYGETVLQTISARPADTPARDRDDRGRDAQPHEIRR